MAIFASCSVGRGDDDPGSGSLEQAGHDRQPTAAAVRRHQHDVAAFEDIRIRPEERVSADHFDARGHMPEHGSHRAFLQGRKVHEQRARAHPGRYTGSHSFDSVQGHRQYHDVETARIVQRYLFYAERCCGLRCVATRRDADVQTRLLQEARAPAPHGAGAAHDQCLIPRHRAHSSP